MSTARQFIVAFALTAAFTTACGTEAMRAALASNGAVQVQNVPIPEPMAGQVRVKVHAAGVNPVDWKRAGYPAGSAPASARAPMIPGFDLAGTIERVGPAVTDWKVGDAVMVSLDPAGGAYAEYAVAPVSAIARKPPELSFEQAAGLPTVAWTAWDVLVEGAQVRAGQRVLVQGGAGGVGSAAVQIAKARGAYVIATASQRNHGYLQSIGADETIDYRTERFEDKAKDVDVVVNTVDAQTATRSISVVKKGGVVISVAGRADAGQCAAAGVRCLTRTDGSSVSAVLDEVAKLAAAGKFDVNVDGTYALEDVEKAWASSREGHTRGKLVIRLR